MLIIRRAQWAQLQSHARSESAARIVRALARGFPGDAARLGDEALACVVELGLERGAEHGLSIEPQIFLYVALMMMLGSHFDRDPLLPWAAEALAADAGGGPAERIDRTYSMAMDHLDRIAGRDNEHLRRALLRLKALDTETLGAGAEADFGARLLATLTQCWPEKAEAIGPDLLAALPARARAVAAREGVHGTRGGTVVGLLMFMLGSGFADDPQFAGVWDAGRAAASVAGSAAGEDSIVAAWLAQALGLLDDALAGAAAAAAA